MRGIPQTYFYCKVCNGKGCESCKYTGKKYNTSVGELIGNEFLKYTHGSNFIFHGCGREDIDALMLGNGRPFVLEIKDPMIRSINLYEIENIINKSNKE